MKIFKWYVRLPQIYCEYRNKKDFPLGCIVQACNYHPSIVVANDGDILDVISILTLERRCCSLYGCGVYQMSVDEIENHVLAYKDFGERGVALLNGWTNEDFDKFEKQWKGVQ